MNFVLVHGAWHGGWCWRDVARTLRAAGHEVFTPTMTGLGERAHLLNAAVDLSTCIEDVCSLIRNEELSDVVLVGHSFAGPVISGVADRMPQALRQLIFLDALIVQHGQCALDVLPPAVREERSRTLDAEGLRMAIPEPVKFGITDPAQAAWLRRRLTPHPLKAYSQPLQLSAPIGNGLACTYIAATDPWYGAGQASRDWVKAQADWGWREIAAGHDAMVSQPQLLARMLQEIALGNAEG